MAGSVYVSKVFLLYTDFMMVKWSCCSALWFNNHIISNASGNKLKFYCLPRSTELQREYSRILQTTGINWNSAYICSQHWSKGFRENVKDLPDVPAHESQIARLQIKLEKARRQNNTSLAKALSKKIELATWLPLKPFAIQRKTPSDHSSTPLAATRSSTFASGKQDNPVIGSLLLSWKSEAGTHENRQRAGRCMQENRNVGGLQQASYAGNPETRGGKRRTWGY